MNKHKWKPEIEHFINGGKVQCHTYKFITGFEWFDIESDSPLGVFDNDTVLFRIKPEPKPDVEMVCAIKFPAIERWAWERPEIVASWIKPKSAGYGRYKPNIKFIFDGETEQLKSAEVMK